MTTLRREFINSLSDLGFIPFKSNPNTPELNVNSENTNLLKAVVLGGLWPRVARVHLPKAAIKFDKVQAGTVQRENTAREFKMFDLKEGRVFLHPGSLLFDASVWKSPFLVYFHKYMTSKVFLRDATEVSLNDLIVAQSFTAYNNIGPPVCAVIVRWPSFCEPCCRRRDHRETGKLCKTQGVASNRGTC